MLSTVEKVLALKRVQWFESLPSEELAQIARVCREIVFEAGEEMMREGELGDCLYLILGGTCRVVRGERELTRLGPGAVVGEMAILDSDPRSATVVGFDTVHALKLGREDFYDILSDRPEIALGIIQTLSRRLRDEMRHARVAASEPAPAGPGASQGGEDEAPVPELPGTVEPGR